ncbi:MAG: hypothetical protein NC548_50340 [Lachnospiraceae bacterium]|nr:hypothetical protein [Lachnospiraceae bacterium]
MRKYRMGFDLWGLLLFLVIMLPNLIWFLAPAPVDVLRAPSVTPAIDRLASVFQVVMVAAICLLRSGDYKKPMEKGWRWGIAAAVFLYYVGWGAYYAGIIGAPVIMGLCIAPCAAFILFALARRNGIALVGAAVFMLCHGYYGVVNYL